MFGHKHEWIKAKGVVVAADRQEAQYVDGVMGQTVDAYVVDVHPDGAEVFRAQVDPGGVNVPGFHYESSRFRHPDVGETVSVEYDRRTQDVRFDMADPALHTPTMHQRNLDTHAAFEQALQGGVGSTPAGGPAGAVPGLQGSAGLAQLLQMAQQGGGRAQVVDLSGAGAQTGTHRDPVERLTKLAKLKDAGLIDDAQFSELKAKILEES